MTKTPNQDFESQDDGTNNARQNPAPTSDSFRQMRESGSSQRPPEEGSRTDPVIINRIQ